MKGMAKQRLFGLALLLACAAILALASQGETVEDQDATPVMMLGPLGIYMMTTRKYILYDGEVSNPEPDVMPEGTRRRAESGTPAPRPSRARRKRRRCILKGDQSIWQENVS